MKFFSVRAFDIPDAWIQVVEKIYNEGDEFRVGFLVWLIDASYKLEYVHF